MVVGTSIHGRIVALDTEGRVWTKTSWNGKWTKWTLLPGPGELGDEESEAEKG